MTTLPNRSAINPAVEWLLGTEQGHNALTLAIAFLIPWAMFT